MGDDDLDAILNQILERMSREELGKMLSAIGKPGTVAVRTSLDGDVITYKSIAWPDLYRTEPEDKDPDHA